MKKSIKILLITIGIIFGLLLLTILILPKPLAKAVYNQNFSVRCSTYKPFAPNLSDYADLSREKHTFKSDKNQTLVGYKYFYTPDSQKGLVVLAHGFGGGGHINYLNIIDYFAKNGYLVFAYDATGNDESEGEVVGGLPQGIIDLDYALQYVKSTQEFQNLPIYLWGHSWGGYSVGSVLKLHPDIKAACVVAGFNSSIDMLESEGRNIAGSVIDFVLPAFEKLEKELFGEIASMSILESVESVDVPVMFIHCADDRMIPISTSFDRYYEKFSNDSKYSFVKFEDRGHNYLCFSDEARNYRNEYNQACNLYAQSVEEVTNEMWFSYDSKNFDTKRAFQLDEELMSKILEFYQ